MYKIYKLTRKGSERFRRAERTRIPLERVKQAKSIDWINVATTLEEHDNEIESSCIKTNQAALGAEKLMHP